MSVIVKGMEMPKNCRECPMVHREFDGYETRLDCYMIQDWCPEDEGVHPDCPLIALPDHHGRLMDADAMLNRLQAWNTSDRMDKALYNFTWHRIMEQPTIVEEEGENADHE